MQLVVVPLGQGTATWVARTFRQIRVDRHEPLSVADAEVPEIIDVAEAKRAPARSVFSAVWYGRSRDSDRAALIAYAAVQACVGLERELGELYFRLIDGALTLAASRKLEVLMTSNSPSQLGYFGQKRFNEGLEQGREQGWEQGREQGRALVLTRILTLRFGELPQWASEQLNAASPEELDLWVDRFLSARSLEEVIRS